MNVALRTCTRSIKSPRSAAGLALVLLAATVVLVAGWLQPSPSLLRGWLFGFAVWSCAPIGAMTLLLIHRLTGGRWGRAAAPVLRPLAILTPLVAVGFVPVLAGLPRIYPWAANPGLIPPDVAHWYLGETSFILRALVALIGWSVLGVTFAVGAGGRLMAALGLAFFGLTISLVAVDWFLSVEPHYVASAFPAMIAVQQLLAALAVVAVISPPTLQGEVAGDLGGLLIATLLGVVYLEYMTFVVAWYGDLPDKAAWFLARSPVPWRAVLIAAFAAGAVLPFAMLLLKAVRSSRRGLRVAGLLLLSGTVLHLAWLLVPAFAAQPAVAAVGVAALIVLTIASMLFARGATEASHAQ